MGQEREQNTKKAPKNINFQISKNKKMCFFLMSQGSFSPKIRSLGQKVWSVARGQTDGHTVRHESENRGHPFQGFRIYFFIFKFTFSLSSRSGPTSTMSSCNRNYCRHKQCVARPIIFTMAILYSLLNMAKVTIKKKTDE